MQEDWPEFYCEELFLVKHKSSYSCESAIYFNLTTDIIKNNCNFDFYLNKTDVTPTVWDGGDEIVLANWPNDKHIICNMNSDVPVKIASHLYVLVNRNVLCNCGIEADNHYLLVYLLQHAIIKITIWLCTSPLTWPLLITFDMLPNITTLSLIRDRTTYEQPLPINLSFPAFDTSLKGASIQNLKISYKTMLSTKKFWISNKGMYLQLNP